jgi:hypothetical protein
MHREMSDCIWLERLYDEVEGDVEIMSYTPFPRFSNAIKPALLILPRCQSPAAEMANRSERRSTATNPTGERGSARIASPIAAPSTTSPFFSPPTTPSFMDLTPKVRFIVYDYLPLCNTILTCGFRFADREILQEYDEAARSFVICHVVAVKEALFDLSVSEAQLQNRQCEQSNSTLWFAYYVN